MKLFLLSLLVLGTKALPQFGSADDDTQYTNRDGTNLNIDSGLVEDVFGTAGGNTPDNRNSAENYNDIEPVKTQVDTTSTSCSDYASQGYKCVNYFACDDDGLIITDGTGGIDIRFGKGHNKKEPKKNVQAFIDPTLSKCPGFLDVCCKHPDFNLPSTTTPKTTTTYTPAPYTAQCGQRHYNGYGVRIQNVNSYDSSTQFGEFPHMCAVLKKDIIGGEERNLYTCGASLIAPGVIMTAAHCVRDIPAEQLRVRCGEWDTQGTQEPLYHQDREIEYVSLHPEFNPGNLQWDFAFLYTYDDFILDYHVDTICLPTNRFGDYVNSYKNKDCIATGWGKDKFGKEGQYQVIMKGVPLDLVDNCQCQNALRTTEKLSSDFKLHKSFICAGGREGQDTCKGDGGGPLICPINDGTPYDSNNRPTRYTMAGLIAWGVGCGQAGIPGVYANVADSLCFLHHDVQCKRGDKYVNYFNIQGCDDWIPGRKKAVSDRLAYLESLEKVPRRKRFHALASINNYNIFWDKCAFKPSNLVDQGNNPYSGGDDYYDYDSEYGTDLSSFQRSHIKDVTKYFDDVSCTYQPLRADEGQTRSVDPKTADDEQTSDKQR